MICAAYSDVGKKRLENEDSFFVSDFSDKSGFIIVADGMGGHNGGKTASKMAVDTIKECFSHNIILENQKDIRKVLKDSIELANKKIFESSLCDEKLFGMGTTIVLCYIKENNLYIANVGDSRLYHIKKDVINQVTKDHSLVQELVDKGEISEEEAENHPNKNLITRAVGTNKDVEIDFYKFCAEKDDMVIICTDGLSNMVKKDEIKKIACENEDIHSCVKKLVDEANLMGGPDNITVAALRF
ncbi:MAG: Stp1/IreP family PP2C-type Ser/Thr phosphatase [Ruminococcaceae bacterium]|nr:Stp1/IreP family PP2C-type Ser/Thr phosphatase [Oscillospiraceae bacterium]